jgi:uncharacterized protein YndB with AHSA1/START domain
MESIRVETIINRGIGKVWEMFTEPKDIVKWNYPSDEWECPYAKNDFKINKRFVYRMMTKDKKICFNFTGTYKEIVTGKIISYMFDDRRKVTITFEKITGATTKIIEVFHPERNNSVDMQRNSWQAILDNFKKYVEANSEMTKVADSVRTGSGAVVSSDEVDVWID